jgi:hypothetical protein
VGIFLQKSCIDFTIGARPLERYMPSKRNSFKYKVWRIVVSTPFEYFIMILIVLNTLLLMMKVCQYLVDVVLQLLTELCSCELVDAVYLCSNHRVYYILVLQNTFSVLICFTFNQSFTNISKYISSFHVLYVSTFFTVLNYFRTKILCEICCLS